MVWVCAAGGCGVRVYREKDAEDVAARLEENRKAQKGFMDAERVYMRVVGVTEEDAEERVK